MGRKGKVRQTSAVDAAGVANAATLSDYSVILSPVITEKSSLVGSGGNRIVFRVAAGADKNDIRAAVERAFKVTVASVRTCNLLGKTKRTAKGEVRRPAIRKAYVTLKEGQTIDIVEGP